MIFANNFSASMIVSVFCNTDERHYSLLNFTNNLTFHGNRAMRDKLNNANHNYAGKCLTLGFSV